jgi:hypothetical protein
MRRRSSSSVSLVAAALAALVACGGGGGDTTACTLGAGASRTCVEYAGLTGEASQGQNQACVDAGGVVSATCSHAGADGGCRIAQGSGSITNWSYAGNASALMMACVGNGNSWISP